MSLLRSIAHNALIQGGGKIINTLLAVIGFGLMTRYLGQIGFGEFTTITSFLQFFGILADMGLSLIAIQMISEIGQDKEKNFNNIFTFRLITVLILVGIAPVAALVFPYSESIKIGIALMALSYVLNSIIQLLTVIFQVQLKTSVPVIADFVGKIVLIAGIVLVMHLHGNLWHILIVILINNIIPAIAIYIYSQSYFRIRLAFDFVLWKEIMRRTWPIGLSIIFNLLYLRTDTIILSLYHPQNIVGLYGAAYRVIDVLMTLPMMFMGITLASFSRAWSAQDMPSFQRYLQKSFDALAIVAVPLVVGTFFLAGPLMSLVAGSTFTKSGEILKVLIVAAGIIFFSTCFGALINVIHEQKRMIAGYALGALVGLGAYFIFIPTYGVWAASWITVLSETIILVASALLFYRKTRMIPTLATLFKSLISAGGMALFFIFFPSLPFLVACIIGSTVYLGLLYITGGISRDMIIAIFGKREHLDSTRDA